MKGYNNIILKNKNVPHQTHNLREQKSGKMGITFVVGVMSVPLFVELFCSFLNVQVMDEVDSQSN